ILTTDMNLPEGNCIELVEKTAAVLHEKALQALFVSTQRNQIELSFQYAVQLSNEDITCSSNLQVETNIFFCCKSARLGNLCDWFPMNGGKLHVCL
ncbi:hypothetical protein L208DRAFT_1397716, partial [Tricholoma matsutake]